jgi:hypothetical protein
MSCAWSDDSRMREVAAEVAELRASEDDLLESLVHAGQDLVDNPLDRHADLPAARVRDNTEGTQLVAALLYLHERPRPQAAANRRRATCRRIAALAQAFEKPLGDRVLLGPFEDDIGARQVENIRRSGLRIAAREHDLRLGREPAGQASEMPCLAVGYVRNRTGIDHERIRTARRPIADTYPLAGQPAGDRLRIGLVQLAAKREYGNDGRIVRHHPP